MTRKGESHRIVVLVLTCAESSSKVTKKVSPIHGMWSLMRGKNF